MAFVVLVVFVVFVLVWLVAVVFVVLVGCVWLVVFVPVWFAGGFVVFAGLGQSFLQLCVLSPFSHMPLPQMDFLDLLNFANVPSAPDIATIMPTKTIRANAIHTYVGFSFIHNFFLVIIFASSIENYKTYIYIFR